MYCCVVDPIQRSQSKVNVCLHGYTCLSGISMPLEHSQGLLVEWEAYITYEWSTYNVWILTPGMATLHPRMLVVIMGGHREI